MDKIGEWVFLILSSWFVSEAHCARILGLFPSNLASHDLVLSPLLEALATRGHNVTVASFFPKAAENLNYSSVSLVKTTNSTEKLEIGSVGLYKNYIYTNLVLLRGFQDEYEDVLVNPKIIALMNEEFDLIIVEYFHSEVFSGLIHKMKTPFVLFHTTEPLVWHRDVLREPLSPSHVPHILNRRPRRPITFWWRLVNTLEIFCTLFYYNMAIRPRARQMTRDHLGEIPQLDDLTRNASLYLVNTHFTIHGVIPTSRAVVEIGGIHLKPKKQLPQDIKKLLDIAEKGVIYFSMGSLLHGTSLDWMQRDAVIRVFEKLNQTIVWKWEGSLEEKPDNVHTWRWLPQRDILAHPNIVLFISHCGLLSVFEAVTEAVPMLCLPVFADQPFNARIVEEKGFGLSGDLKRITNETYFSNKVEKILKNAEFKQNAQKISSAFKDRPMPPLDEAVYWINYVIRHGGATHLHSEARNLAWFEYHNLDVLAVVLSMLCISVAVPIWLALVLTRRVIVECSRKKLKTL